MRLCQYSNLLGKPGQGAHAIQVGGVAVVDVLLTVVGAWLLAKGFQWNFWLTLGGLFILGIFLHWLFCVSTTVNKWLGL